MVFSWAASTLWSPWAAMVYGIILLLNFAHGDIIMVVPTFHGL